MAFGDVRGTLVGSNISIPATFPAAGSVLVQIGDLIVGVVAEQTGLTNTACGDNLTNTYTAQNAGTDSGNSTGRMWYSRVTKPGVLTAVNFTCTGSTHNGSCVAVVYAGPFTSPPIDANPANGASDITSPFTCPTTGTLAQSIELVVGWAAGGAGVTANWTASSGITRLDVQNTDSGTTELAVIGSTVTAATTAVIPAFAGTAVSSDDVLGTASFKKDLTNPNSSVSYVLPVISGYPPAQNPSLNTWIVSGIGLSTVVVQNIPPGDILYDLTPRNKYSPENNPSLRTWVQNPRQVVPAVLLPLPFDWGYQEKLNWYREWTFNATVRLPVVVTAVPFKQTDWPNPKGYYSTNYNWYQNWIVNLSELPQPTPILLPLPFDWGYQEKLQWYRDWILNATIRLPITVVTAPFNQDDWPNPKFNPTLDYSYIEFMDLARNASLGKPFRQLEWVNPAIPPRPDFTYIEVMDLPRNHSLGKTFNQTDWPNFREFRDKREWTWNYNLNLIGKDRLPIRQQDWPNPSVITWYKDWNNNLILIVPVVAGTPFFQSDWPLPLAPTYWARDWNQNLILTFGPTPPVVATDLHFKPVLTTMGRMGNLGGLN